MAAPTARAAGLAAACAGGAYYLYRRSRAASEEEVCGRAASKKTRLCQMEPEPADPLPPENPELRPHVDAALRLRDLRFAPWSSEGGLEISYSKDALFRRVPRKWSKRAAARRATAAAWRPEGASSLALAIATLAAAAALNFGGIAHITLAIFVWLACLCVVVCVQAHHAARVGPKVEAVRATATLKPSAAPAVWQAAALWAADAPKAAAPGGGGARQRGIAKRAASGVLVEARICDASAAPRTAFVLEPLGEDSGCKGGLVVHAYLVPSHRMTAAAAAAVVEEELYELLALGGCSLPGCLAGAGGAASAAADSDEILSSSKYPARQAMVFLAQTDRAWGG